MTPAPRISGDDLIPKASPFIVVFNHYESPRIPAWWGPFLMTRVIETRRTRERHADASPVGPVSDQTPVHWLMAREWWYPGGLGRLVKQPLTRLFYARLARVYGFITVPPVLDGDLYRGEGVSGVRKALALTRGDHPAVVGLAPEGNSGPNGALKRPASGTGLFLILLTHEKIPMLPIGWFEDQDGALTIQFGAPFQLRLQRMKDRHERDRLAATEVMIAIGRLLPEGLWGEFKEEIGRVAGGGESKEEGGAQIERSGEREAGQAH